MLSADYKKWAKESLRGKWGLAMGVCIVAGLLGGGIDMVSGVFNPAAEETTGMLDLASTDAWPMMVSITAVSLLIALVIGGAMVLGCCHFFTGLVSGRKVQFADVFARFKIWHKGLWMQLVVAFFILLWSLIGLAPAAAFIALLVYSNALGFGNGVGVALLFAFAMIPGIVASYRYAMTPYLLAEFPDLTVMEAIRESKRLMQGNKWQLFCLQFSFFGWVFLALLTAGIAFLWVEPYMNAANAAFYLQITGRGGLRYAKEAE